MNRDYHQTDLWQKSRLLFLLVARQSGANQDLLKSIVLSLLHQISLAFDDSDKNNYQRHLTHALSMVCLIKNKIADTDFVKYSDPDLTLLLNRLMRELKLAILKNSDNQLTVHVECDVNSILKRRWPYDKNN